jgi:hypothetical protein
MDKLLASRVQLTKEEIAQCATDFAYFCSFVNIVEPRPPVPEDKDLNFDNYLSGLSKGEPLKPEQLELLDKEVGSDQTPFILYDYQVELAHWFNWLLSIGEQGAVEKSRDMGYSWLVCTWAVWCWRFKPKFSALFGSKKEAAVDNGTVSSLFGKMDYVIEHMHPDLKPKGYDRRLHRTRLKIVHPTNPVNYIVGDSQTPDFGASERHSVVIPDETALMDYDPSATVSNTANTVIYGSTVRGENHFFRTVERLRARSPHLVRKLNWNLNPTHTQGWYKRMQSSMDEADFAREVLIDYKASVKGKYYPICNLVTKLPEIQWQPGWPSVISIDYGVDDNAAFIWWQKDPRPGAIKPHKMMFCYTNNGKPIRFYLPFLKAELPQEWVQVTDESGYLVFDNADNPVIVRNPFEYTTEEVRFIQRLRTAGVSDAISYRGDPAGSQRGQQTAISVETVLERAGVYVFTETKYNDYASRRSAFTEVLMNCEVNEAGAWEAFNAISQAKYPDRREGSQNTSAPNAPVHDWTSHYRSAGEYYAVGELETDDSTSGSVIIMSARM